LAGAKETEASSSTELGDDLLDAFEASLGDVTGDDGGRQISLKQHLIKIKDGNEYVLLRDSKDVMLNALRTSQFTLTFDALMIGHDASVTSVAWNPSAMPPVLLSTSVDSSVILWSPTTIGADTDESNQLWTNHHRFGDVGGQRLGGFVGGAWLSSDELCAWGWNGGFRRWRNLETAGEELQAITGHCGGVHGVSWNESGEYFITARSAFFPISRLVSTSY
jgi:WD40 repeat protein